MPEGEFDDPRPQVIVVNDEGQHSIWPAEAPLPLGWRQIGDPAPRQECLDRIEQLWTDVRPLSARTRIDDRKRAT